MAQITLDELNRMDRAAFVAALGEVVWHIDRNDSTQPCHARDDNRIRSIRP